MTISFFNNKASILLLFVLVNVTAFAQNNTIAFTVNGLKVILRQTQKETLVMNMYFKGGSTNYTAANAGIEQLALSAAVECGTNAYKAADFNDQVDEYGLSFAGDANNDYGVIKLGCISRYANEGFKLFAAAITAPTFETQKFDLLKEQQMGDLNTALSNPDARLRQLAQSFAFAKTSYAINPSGTVKTLAALNRDAVKDYYYNTLLNKNRMFLVVAGNISRQTLEKKIQDAFANLPAAPYTPTPVTQGLFAKETAITESRGLATNYVCGIVNAPDVTNGDYPAYRIAMVILNSAMFTVIRINKHLSYAPSAKLIEGKISYVSLYASTTQPRETIESIRDLIQYIKGKTFKTETIEDIQKSMVLSYAKGQERMADIAGDLGEAEIMGDWRLAETLGERINSVTAANMRDVVNKYLGNIKWAYIGNVSLVDGVFFN